jgi:hypothetical protein
MFKELGDFSAPSQVAPSLVSIFPHVTLDAQADFFKWTEVQVKTPIREGSTTACNPD